MDEELENLLNDFKIKSEKILVSELEKFKIIYERTSIMVWPIRTVGVEGDQRTYGYPVEIEIIYAREFIWENEEFIRSLSTRLTNEVAGIYRGEKVVVSKVLYSLRKEN